MSLPTIGMPGMVPGDKWTPDVIEDMMRHETYIYEDNGIDASYYNPVDGTFHFDKMEDGKRIVRRFNTFLELAVFLIMDCATLVIPEVIPENKRTPKGVEEWLKEGHYVWEEDGIDFSYYGPSDGKFHFTWLTEKEGSPEQEYRVRDFDTFLELAVFLAFMGKDFL